MVGARSMALRGTSTRRGFAPGNLKNHNLIYIGEFQNLRVLNKILFKLPIRFQYAPDEKLFLLSEKGDTAQTYLRIEAPYQQKDKFNVDYSVLARMPGPANENFLFIAGFGYSGRLERTRMLKDAGEAFDAARRAGVEMLAWSCTVSEAGIDLAAPVPIDE